MFKLRHISSLLAVAVLMASCDKRDKLDTPDFNVSTAKTTYKVGDSVVFNFTGSPDIITFYSGVAGSEYKFRDRTELEGGTTFMSFSSRVLYGSQLNNVRVMASTNFSGKYDTNAVKAASWTEITDRFTMATAASGAVGVEMQSGVANISDLVQPGKPLYISYRYVGEKPPGSTATQRTWRIMSFNLNNSYPDGSVVSLSNLFGAGWVNVDFQNPANFWKNETTPGYLQFAPNGSLVESEDWAISKPFYVAKVDPDKGVAIKEYMALKKDHVFIYPKAGTYKVTFVGANTNAKEVKPVVKEMEITVTE